MIFEYDENNWIAEFIYRKSFDDLYNEEYDQKAFNYYNPLVTKIRKEFVLNNTKLEDTFDYGCGRNPIGGGYYPCWDRYYKKYSYFDLNKYKKSKTLLLFDVLEHMLDPRAFLIQSHHEKIIITIPIVPFNEFNKINQICNWKHYRPGEHFFYFTESGIKKFCKEAFWNVTYFGWDECKSCGCIREDVASIVLER